LKLYERGGFVLLSVVLFFFLLQWFSSLFVGCGRLLGVVPVWGWRVGFLWFFVNPLFIFIPQIFLAVLKCAYVTQLSFLPLFLPGLGTCNAADVV